jgi:hypothetical protein
MKIISKDEILEIDNNKIVSDKKENIQLNNLAKEKKRPPMVSAPRRIKTPQITKEKIEALIRNRVPEYDITPTPKYKEYRKSLSNTIDKSLSLIETDDVKKNGLIDKIKSSNDIQHIVKDRILNLLTPLESNDFLSLLVTIGSFYIENKLT